MREPLKLQHNVEIVIQQHNNSKSTSNGSGSKSNSTTISSSPRHDARRTTQRALQEQCPRVKLESCISEISPRNTSRNNIAVGPSSLQDPRCRRVGIQYSSSIVHAKLAAIFAISAMSPRGRISEESEESWACSSVSHGLPGIFVFSYCCCHTRRPACVRESDCNCSDCCTATDSCTASTSLPPLSISRALIG